MTRKWWVLAAVGCGTFMATLDSSIVNIVLPTLTKTLNSDLGRVKWVVIVYLLTITCLLLPFGKLSDLHGRKKTFQAGFLVFAIGSLLCSLAGNLNFLVLFRLLQGAGAAMLMANGPAIITATFPAGERGKALGTLAMIVSTGLISGPSLGGILISQLGWRSIFWINIPVAGLGIFLAQRFIVRDAPRSGLQRFDWVGVFLQTLFMVCFILLVEPPQIAISGGLPFALPRGLLLLFCVILGLLFHRVESEAQSPILDAALFRLRPFWLGNLAGFLTFVSFSAMTVLMPFFLEMVLHLDTQKAGLVMTAVPLTVFVVAPVAGRMSDRLGTRGLAAFGDFVGSLGLFLMGGVFGNGVAAEAGVASVVGGLCVIGLATGLFQSPNNNAIMGSIPESKLGVASAMLATVRNLGLVTGTGFGTWLFAWAYRDTADFIASLHVVLRAAGVIAFLAGMVSLVRRKSLADSGFVVGSERPPEG